MFGLSVVKRILLPKRYRRCIRVLIAKIVGSVFSYELCLQSVFANYVHRLSLHFYDTNTPRRRIGTQTTNIEGLSRGRCFLALALYIKTGFKFKTLLILTLAVLYIAVGDTVGFNYE